MRHFAAQEDDVIPLHRAPRYALPRRQRIQKLSPPKRRILLANDELMHRQLSAGIDLLMHAWESYFVPRPEKFVAAAIACQPHVILLSAYDPGLHGFEAYRRLRSVRALRSVAIVIVMGEEDTCFHSLAHQLGCNTILKAPIGGIRMLQELKDLLAPVED